MVSKGHNCHVLKIFCKEGMHSLWIAHIREVAPNADKVACILVEGIVLFSLLEFLLFSRGERFLLNDDGFSFFALSE